VGDPITLMDSDPLITFMKVIVTFYPLLWIRLLVSFIAIWAERLQVQVFSDMNPCVVRTQSDADCCMSLCIHRV